MIFMIALNDCLEWLVMVLMQKQQCNKLVISSKIKETSGICWFCLYPKCRRKSSRADCQYGRWQKKGTDALINSPIFHHIKNLNNSGVWIILPFLLTLFLQIPQINLSTFHHYYLLVITPWEAQSMLGCSTHELKSTATPYIGILIWAGWVVLHVNKKTKQLHA